MSPQSLGLHRLLKKSLEPSTLQRLNVDMNSTLIGQGNVLGVGNSDGTVQLWDVASSKLIRSMAGHTDRVRVLLDTLTV